MTCVSTTNVGTEVGEVVGNEVGETVGEAVGEAVVVESARCITEVRGQRRARVCAIASVLIVAPEWIVHARCVGTCRYMERPYSMVY